MESSTQNAVTILDVCRITPASNLSEFSMPITFFDSGFLHLPTIATIFLYQLTDSSPCHLNSVIVPNLKRSLSLTITHFFPLAGRLTWPPHDPIPSILYKPNDSVSLTIAESTNPESFTLLAGNKPFKASESRPYVPELHTTDSEAAAISLQVTLFPNHGIAMGVGFHHAILDAKSVSLFMKAWAHVNKQLQFSTSLDSASLLPPELTPFLDRSVVEDSEALCLKVLERLEELRPPSASRRSLKLPTTSDLDPTLVRATFEVSLDDARKLRELALSKLGIHLSTFVLAYSYSLTCLVKAKNGQLGSLKEVTCGIPAECRSYLDPSLHENYIGNCLVGCFVDVSEEVVRAENGFVDVAKIISECIRGVRNKSVYQAFNDNLPPPSPPGKGEVHFGVAGSPRLEFYQIDFGWGRPVKFEFTSIDWTRGISMADANGGIEIGLVMTKGEMEVFHSLFVSGLKHLSG